MSVAPYKIQQDPDTFIRRELLKVAIFCLIGSGEGLVFFADFIHALLYHAAPEYRRLLRAAQPGSQGSGLIHRAFSLSVLM